MAEQYRKRPSELLGLSDDPYSAYCLDEACYLWGAHVETELEMASRDPKDLNRKEVKSAQNRRQLVYRRLMEGVEAGGPTASSVEEKKTTSGRFRDPALLVGKKG